MTGFEYGNGIDAIYTYNERQQISGIRYDDPSNSADVLNLAYIYRSGPTATDNNGQIRKIEYYTQPGTIDNTKSTEYQYDVWYRLKVAKTTTVDANIAGTYELEWVYDRFGNRLSQNLNGGNITISQPQLTVSESTNRITTSGFTYDAAGNLTQDAVYKYKYES